MTPRAARLRDLLVSINPGRGGIVYVTTKTGLLPLTRYAAPGELRTAGRARVLAHLRKLDHVKAASITALADAALAAAHAQTISVPGEAVAADLVRDLARGMLTARDQLHHLDRRIEGRSEEHTSELQSLMRTSDAVFS